MLIINCLNITDMDNHTYAAFRNAVSSTRRSKADRYHFIEDAKRCVCAELLLRYSLFQKLGYFIELDMSYNEFGKPFLKSADSFSYNLSHSGKWVVIAYGGSEVGIDVEKIQENRVCIINRFFTEEEKNYILAADETMQNNRFTQIWTLKESYIKFLGTGLATSLDSFSVNARNHTITSQNGGIQEDVQLYSYRFYTDYYLSVCSREKKVDRYEITLKDLYQFVQIMDVGNGVSKSPE